MKTTLQWKFSGQEFEDGSLIADWKKIEVAPWHLQIESQYEMTFDIYEIVTGNTAAHRGIPTYALFAPTKAAQRILAQSLARELGPNGIHVAYLTIDAAIATPWSKDLPVQGKNTQPLNQTQIILEDFFCQPVDIAKEIFHLAHQPRSAWSFDVEIRPFAEKW